MAYKSKQQSGEHIIQVPLYTIPLNEEDASASFFPTKYEEIIDMIIDRLRIFSPHELKNNKKEKKTLIECLSYQEKR